MLFGVHGLHAGDGDQEDRKSTIEGRKEGTREKNEGGLCRSAFMAFTPATETKKTEN